MIKEKDKTSTINPLMKDPVFLQTFANRPIKLIAPASRWDNDQQMACLKTLLPCVNATAPEDLISDCVPYHTNTDEKRFKFLKAALFGKSKKTIIWTLRGGYGSARLLERLALLPKPKQEKLFIGYSDITALHLFLSQRWGWKTLHGVGLTELVYPYKDLKNLTLISDLITHKISCLTLDTLQPLNIAAKNVNKIKGQMMGGNLSIVQTSIGTLWQMKGAQKIIFLEDVKEKGYQIDRMLNHLKESHVFAKARAIIFGDFIEGGDPFVNFALERFAKESEIPVFKTNEFGHGKINHPILYNAKSEILFNPSTKCYQLKMYVEDT